MTRASVSRFAAFAALSVCFAHAVLAQNTNSGDIRGTVTDATGAVVPGVAVTLLNTNTGITRELSTNSAGLYDAVSILPGQYTITFTKEGFQTVVRSGITLDVGAISVDAQLTVGGTQQQIQVTGEAPLLKTENAQQSTNLQAKTMEGLPNVGQNWQNFVKLIPGANGTPASDAGAANPGVGVAINGSLPFYSSFLADGASIRLPHSANVDNQISESVSEVQINTSTFSSEYGGGGAVFNVISKSGSNQWHGAAYEYFENDALNARSFFDGKSAARVRYNNFGGSVGGPLLKNKLFFFYNFDKTINPSSTTTTTTVPTDAMKQGVFDATIFGIIRDPSNGQPFLNNQIPRARMDPVALAVQQYYPTANLAGITNNYRFQQLGTNTQVRQFGRLDYNLRSDNRLTMSIKERGSTGSTLGTTCPVNCQNNTSESYEGQISDVHTFSPTVVNEFRYGYTRQANWFTPGSLGLGFPQKIGLQYAKLDLFPNINITGTATNNTLNPQTSAIYIQNAFNPSDVVTMIRGKHILHFGGEVLIYQDNSTPWGNLSAANFTFNGQFTQANVGYADFLVGQAQAWSALNQGEAGMRSKNPSLFVQDDIKLRPNLTLNVGMRWEVHGGFTEVNNRAGSFDPTIINPVTNTLGAIWFAGNNGRNKIMATDYKIFLPRVGVAWSPTTKWSVRGGFGMYSSLWSVDVNGSPLGFGSANGGSVSANPGQAPVANLSGSGAGLPYVLASRDPGAYNGQGGGNIPYMPYNTPTSRIYQWSVSIQRQFGGGIVAEAAYVGSHADGLQFQSNINQVPADKLGQGQSGRPFPQFLGIGPSVPGGLTGSFNNVSNYNSMQLSVRKRFSHGLSADVNYTWSKMLDNQDTSGWGSHYGDANYQDAFNVGRNYGLSNFDVPQAFKGYVVYQIPLGRGHAILSHGIADVLLGGWQASSMFIAQSGVPFTPTMASSTDSGALGGQWFPNVVGNPSVQNQTINQWFNQLAYATPATNTFGNSGRNTLRGPDLTSIDFSLAKTFRIPKFERGGLQIRMDATNIVNHPSFKLPNAKLNAAALASGVPDPSVGQVTDVSVPGRFFQLGARFTF
ncbi:MAG TPA: TonB-dependent receptor [Bryobacteraceae bacterium]|nr:TonB-dependent receptor [Bryobacteraceae bacterium]